MTGSLSWFGVAHLRARALAASSALLGALMVAATSGPAVAQLMGHFGISWSEAAQIIDKQPATLQLRYLQTLTEIANEKNSTIVFPLPIDLIQMFLKRDKS